MHLSIRFTFEKQEIIYENEKKVQVLQPKWHWNVLKTNEYSRLLTIR